MKKVLLLLLLLPMHTFVQAKKQADLIISHGFIFAVSPEWRIYEALAVKNGKIVALGTNDEVLNEYESKTVIDATDKYVYPGFIDAHCHFSGYALDKYKCDLTGTRSFGEVLQKVRAYEKKNKLSWIYGRGWDQNDWEVKEYPTKEALDSLFPKKPVILKRVDGHALLCNQKALDMAHIAVNTEISGGIIEKKDGKLTGILTDNAMAPVEKLIPALPKAEAIKYLLQAQRECYEYGLTTVVDCGVKKKVIELLKELYAEKKLTIGNDILLADDPETLTELAPKGTQHFGQLQISGIKMYADGALGSRGACLLEDYSDMPGNEGQIITPVPHMKELAELALKYNLQLCTHAIGDSANRVVLKIYTDYLKTKNDKRWRVEHAQVTNPADLHYFGDYSIIPSVQPTHFPSDMPWAMQRLGKRRLANAYAYKDLLKQNGWEALGTDFPVEGINPIKTFYTAVYRTNYPEGRGIYMQNALDKVEAIRGMTIWAAKSVFMDKEKGSIEAGKDADIVILNNNLTEISQASTLSTSVLYTIVKGKIVYKYSPKK